MEITRRIKFRDLVVLLISSLVLLPMGGARARDLTTTEKTQAIDMKEIWVWLQGRFSGGESETFRPEDLGVEPHFCGCYDKPHPHFPYSVVLFVTPKGALVGRAEGREGEMSITPLAIRYGNRYCEVESDERCYGSFDHPCDFTDFRYGPSLAEYFPTCKSDEAEPGLVPPHDGDAPLR